MARAAGRQLGGSILGANTSSLTIPSARDSLYGTITVEPEPEWIDLLVDAQVVSRDEAKNKVARGNAFREAFRRMLAGRLLGT